MANYIQAPRRRKRRFSKAQLADDQIDYKNVDLLKSLMNPAAKIMSRRATGISSDKQRRIRRQILIARRIGLLPFTDKYF